MHKCASSAELLAAVDFGDAMSNPLHKNIDLYGLHLIHTFRSRQNLLAGVYKPDFFSDTSLLKPRFIRRNRVDECLS
ncbi:hypothetical protein QT989_23090 [Microcoleus sp. SVA1_B6]|uniref:hypothetical protein n=1 Tax=Microcoleus sp. SVA1_B6 TaxID=2818952 RepID=UPI002FCFADB6